MAWLIARFRKARQRRAMARRIAALTPAERDHHLQASSFEPYWEQGMEGDAYVILKFERDLGAAMAGGPGLFPSLEAAENWIIAQEIDRGGAV